MAVLTVVVVSKKRSRGGNHNKSPLPKSRAAPLPEGGQIAGEESEQEEEGEQRDLAIFSAFQNHYLWGWRVSTKERI